MENVPKKHTHHQLIEEILSTAPEAQAAILRIYMDALIDGLLNAEAHIKLLREQRNRAMGVVEEIISDIQIITAPQEEVNKANSELASLLMRVSSKG